MLDQQTALTRPLNRRTFIMAGTAAVAAFLTSCGSSGGSSGSATLQFWGGVPAESGPKALIDAFHKKYPNIKVTYTRFVNDDQGNVKLDTALASGSRVDVYMSYSPALMTRRIDSGLAVDLASYIDADSEVKSWMGSTSGIFQYKNKYWGLPIAKGPSYVFINKNMIEDAGITLPTDWTVDEFREIARKLSKNGVYGTFDTPDLAYATLGADDAYKNGGKESNYDDDVWRKSLQLHSDMIKEKSAFPWTEVLAQNLRVYAQGIFLKGQVGMAINSDFWHRYITDTKNYPHDFVTTFMPIPKPVGVSDPYTVGGLNNWIQINAKTKNRDAAWTFLRFNLGEGAKYMIPSGRNPAFPGTSDDDVIKGLLGANREKLYDVDAYRRVVLQTKFKLMLPTISTAAAELAKIQQSEIDRYLVGEISLDQCINDMKQQADDAIKKAGA
ncbi:MAG: extracellular solute-binding protein [Ktedonobacteraceae bacterium]|nr:extracellular solute-binding protein [Ktedonobacteraceae bacterium]